MFNATRPDHLQKVAVGPAHLTHVRDNLLGDDAAFGEESVTERERSGYFLVAGPATACSDQLVA